MIKNNDFIKKYNKKEFIDLCKNITQELLLLKMEKKIGYYKMDSINKRVTFFKDKKIVKLDYATIFTIGYDNLQSYIEEIIERNLNERVINNWR